MTETAGLVVEHLCVSYGPARVLDDVSFTVAPGESVALVGRSGAGKSTVINALIGLLGSGANVSGEIALHGRSLRALSEKQWQEVRGRLVGVVPQDQYAWFNPVRRIGAQVAETVRAHSAESRTGAETKAVELLTRAGLGTERRVFRSFPFQLSGGMRQRAAIAAAIVNSPQLLLADEPTSSLDALIQIQIIDLLISLRSENQAMLVVSHDESVVTDLCDRVIRLEQGKVVDHRPSAPPSPSVRSRRDEASRNVLEITNVSKHYKHVAALTDVSLEVSEGETLGVVGESGSGKTTLAHLVCGLERVSSGQITCSGRDIDEMSRANRAAHVSLVFQDTAGSLDPRYSVQELVCEPLRVKGVSPSNAIGEAVAMLQMVGIGRDLLGRRPHELSGGQRQRVCIARALVTHPDLVVLDEPTSALDAESRDEVLNLLNTLQSELRIAAILISHDLNVVSAIADRVAVMREGRIVEIGTAEAIIEHPQQPYSRQLSEAVRRLK